MAMALHVCFVLHFCRRAHTLLSRHVILLLCYSPTKSYFPFAAYRSSCIASLQALRLVWTGPNSPAYKVVSSFSHPCSTFVACTNTSINGALPTPVIGLTPDGSTIESSSALRSPSLATFIPNSNVTFTLTFPSLDPSDPNVEDVAYFVREAIANAAGLKLESVWTVPQLDADGNVVFPLGAYFTSVTSAQRFYNTVNLRPQTIFSSSAGLEVSSLGFQVNLPFPRLLHVLSHTEPLLNT